MESFVVALWTSFGLGILMAMSPCPLATNIAAVSFLSHRSESVSFVFKSSFYYVLGRFFAYVVLSFLILKSLFAIPSLSFFLQKYFHLFLGPFLIIVGMFLLELLSVSFFDKLSSKRLQNYFSSRGSWGALGLGFIFALAFCPVSAALFFGSLIPLSLQVNSSFLLPVLFGVGSALPVLLFSFLLVRGTQLVGTFYKKIVLIEKWVRLFTGGLIILIGIYFSLIYIFKFF